MKENELTCNNKKTMIRYHQGCFDKRKKWIFEEHPTATDIATRFPRLLNMKSAVGSDIINLNIFNFFFVLITQVDHDFKSLTDGWTIDAFSKKWLEVEEKILIEISHKTTTLLQPCEYSVNELLQSFQSSSVDIGILFCYHLE